LAAEAEERGEDIEGFLHPARDLKSQTMLMQALHQANYCVSEAEVKFVHLYRSSNEPSSELSDVEKLQADQMFEKSRKDFRGVASKLNRSVGAVLIQYYTWKATERKKGNGAYLRLKNCLKNEEDVCCVCKDGGFLIVCENCHKEFHLNCLKPPLKEAPTGDWYCSQCKTAELRRLASHAAHVTAQEALTFPSTAKQGNQASGKGKDDLIDLTDD
jgi:PHD-finger